MSFSANTNGRLDYVQARALTKRRASSPGSPSELTPQNTRLTGPLLHLRSYASNHLMCQVCASLLMLFVFIGRWTPGRLGDLGDSSASPWQAVMPRLVILGILGAILCFLRRPIAVLPPTRTFLQSGLVYALPTYMCIAYAWGPANEYGYAKLHELLMLLTCLRFADIAMQTFGRKAMLNALYFASFLLLGVLALAALLSMSAGRVAALGGGPNVFGRNMGVLLLSAASPLFIQWPAKAVSYPLHRLFFLLSLLLVFVSGSRGALMASGLGLMYLFAKAGLRKALSLGLGVAALVWLLMYASDLSLVARARDMYYHRVVQKVFEEQYTSGRDTLFSEAVVAGLSQPVWGVGLGGFETHSLTHSYPHNIYLEVFSEGGAVGLLLMLTLTLAWARQLRRASTEGIWLSSVSVVFWGSALVSGDIYDSRGFLLCIMLLR